MTTREYVCIAFGWLLGHVVMVLITAIKEYEMIEKPKALDIAKRLDRKLPSINRLDAELAGDELHRLHELNVELLEALKAYTRFANSRRQELGGLSDEMEAVDSQARDVIKKAEGGAV